MDRNKLGWWSIGGGLVLSVLIFLFGGASQQQATVTRPTVPVPSTPEARIAARARQAAIKASLAESRPPVQNDTMLSYSQILYCLAEKLRIDGGRPVVKESDRERFDALAADFNSRCGAFRYRVQDYEAAKREVAAVSGALRKDGASRFADDVDTIAVESKAPPK